VLEAATGAPVLFAASLPANTSGPQVRLYTYFALCFAFAVKQLARYMAEMPFEIAFARLRSSFSAQRSQHPFFSTECNHVTLSLHTFIAVCVCVAFSEIFHLGQMQFSKAPFPGLN